MGEAQRDLDDISLAIEDLQISSGELESNKRLLEEQLRGLQQELQRARQQVAQIEQGAAQHRRQLEGLEFDNLESSEALADLQQEREQLEDEAGQLDDRHARLEQELTLAQEILVQKREELEDARGRESEVKLMAASRGSEAEHAVQEAKRLAREVEHAGQRAASLAEEITGTAASVESLLKRRGKRADSPGRPLRDHGPPRGGLQTGQGFPRRNPGQGPVPGG